MSEVDPSLLYSICILFISLIGTFSLVMPKPKLILKKIINTCLFLVDI